jgi:hypothetical protein
LGTANLVLTITQSSNWSLNFKNVQFDPEL